MFLCDNQWKFWTIFKTLTLKQIFWKTETFFKKLEYRLKTHHFQTRLPYRKPMLRETEWWVQNGPITKNRVLPVTTLFFWKFCFSLRTSYKKLIWCTNGPNAHILTFWKRWSFIWRCSSLWVSLSIPLFLDTFQLIRETFSYFCFCFIFLCDNWSKYFDWFKKQSLHGISNLDKSNWYFSPLIDRL